VLSGNWTNRPISPWDSKEEKMFESVELRKVQNGIIVTVKSEDEDDREFVFTNMAKAIKFVKEFFENKSAMPA
jgi:hypothetical protein